ncbi:Glycerophosphodiester phosphodiesterase GDE1 [Paramyrothecium foliicola]|nr:Glycerophosphodiester phosphodiesterase GDE1 [Paramyrothecium foliicola]
MLYTPAALTTWIAKQNDTDGIHFGEDREPVLRPKRPLFDVLDSTLAPFPTLTHRPARKASRYSMRFGSRLHLHRVPAWTEYYIDYNLLKVLVDAKPPLESQSGKTQSPPSRCPPELTCHLASDLIEAIESEIDIVDAFLASQDEHLEAHFSALEQRWGFKVGHYTPRDYRGLSSFELQEIKVSLLEIADHIAESQFYFKINLDAISRILDKAMEVTSSSVTLEPPHQAHLALEKVNVTLQYVHKALEDNGGSSPSRSLLLERSGFTQSYHRLQPEILGCLHNDDAAGLEDTLACSFSSSSAARESAFFCLIQVATVYGAFSCHRFLLGSMRSCLANEPSLANHDYLQRIVLKLSQASPPLDNSSAANTFGQILKLLHSSQLHLLQSQDTLGRLPIHYSAIHGLDGVCREILSAVQDSPDYNPLHMVHLSPDKFGLTPLDYAVRKGHTAVVALLLAACETSEGPMKSPLRDTSDLLATAIASKSLDIASLLIRKGWGVRFVGRTGKTVMHLIAEQGLAELVKDMVALGVNVDAQENARGWTALLTASVLGHHAVVEALFKSGAKADIPDSRNWLAKDHAAYRGQLKVSTAINCNGSPRLQPKHERSPSESVIFLHLGTLDLFREMAPPVSIAPYKKRILPLQLHETSLELSISLVHTNQNRTVSLPFVSENSDWPLCFTTDDPDNAAISFKITNLAKDNTPVIYHDFLVTEKGSDTPMHTPTYKQFMAISDAQTPSTWHEVSRKMLPWDERHRPPALPKTRRMSLCAPLDSATDNIRNQMKDTLGYPGYKSNLRHHSIHEPFVSLEHLLCRLPEHVPLDIELKYSMLYEAADFQMDNYATEINHFLDAILSVTYAYASNRRIIFSSFSPEICMVLAVKQQVYPILFLNDSSNRPTGDMRATCLQTAIRFAHRFGLDGVAMSSEPFIYSPGLGLETTYMENISYESGGYHRDL